MKIGKDLCHVKRMDDIRFARDTALTAMCLFRKLIGTADECDIRRGGIRLDIVDQNVY